jgi:hypothetical protein
LELDSDEEVIGTVSDGAVQDIRENLALHASVTQVLLQKRLDRVESRSLCVCNRHTSRKKGKMPGCLKEYLYTATLYKGKGVKVNPVDDAPSDGSIPPGDPNWREKRWEEVKDKVQHHSEYDQFVTGKFSDIEPGSRLTAARLAEILSRVRGVLTKEELAVFAHLLRSREAVLAWDKPHIGRVIESVCPPVVIRTIPHTAWKVPGIRVPPGLIDKAVEVLRQRIDNNLLEESNGAYRNRWFLVQKKDGGVRFINSAEEMNRVTLRDANIPSAADEITEEMARCRILSLVDFFSGYDQVPLAPESRDMTTFATMLGFFRQTTLPQGATNSVGQFIRVVSRILTGLVPDICRSFLDDICVKGPTSDYDGEEIRPGLRRYIIEHLQNLDKVLVNVELSGCTVHATKSQWCCAQAVILGYLCGQGGRSPDEHKVRKIREWPPCADVTQVRGFYHTAGFYREWIKSFAWIAAPLQRLMKKDTEFVWGEGEQKSMDALKDLISAKPVLATLQTGQDAGEIILQVDAGPLGWGANLFQLSDGKKRRAVRYESGLWDAAEAKYDQGKREARAVLKALKALRMILFGLHFKLETDALTLARQLRGSVSDIPNSDIVRWISWIQLFDFEVRHIAGEKNRVADALSRKAPGPSDLQELEDQRKEDLDDWIELEMNPVLIETLSGHPGDAVPVLSQNGGKQEVILNPVTDEIVVSVFMSEDPNPPQVLLPTEGYGEESHRLAQYIAHGIMPPLETRSARRAFVKKARRYLVRDGQLFRTGDDPAQPRRVIDDEDQRRNIIGESHTMFGHRGRDATYKRLFLRYYWPNLYKDVEAFVSRCDQCQRWDPDRKHDGMQYTAPQGLFHKVHIDVQHMPGRYGYLAEARCDLTGWVEAEPITAINARKMLRFLRDKVIFRFGTPLVVVVDGGSENKSVLASLCRRLGVKRVVISAYNPRANGIVEQGHLPLISSIVKMLNGSSQNWVEILPLVLFADRITVRASTGQTPFFLVHGYIPILPIETRYPTWRVLPWDSIEDRDAEVKMRVRMLQTKEEDVEKARKLVAKYRRKAAEAAERRHPRRHRAESRKIVVGDTVLTYDSVRKNDMSTSAKLKFRWEGPFIVEQISDKGTYILKSFAGIPLSRTFAADQVRLYLKNEDGHYEPDEKALLLWTTRGFVHPQQDQDQTVDVDEPERAEVERERSLSEDAQEQDPPGSGRAEGTGDEEEGARTEEEEIETDKDEEEPFFARPRRTRADFVVGRNPTIVVEIPLERSAGATA